MPKLLQSAVAWPGEGLGETGEDMDYRIFRPTYRDRRGETQRSDVYQIAFSDHLRRRQTVAGERRERQTRSVADKVMELVNCRRHGEILSDKLKKWLDGLDDKRRARLEEMDLLDAAGSSADVPLAAQIDGLTDAAGALTLPGWKQELEAKGTTAGHVRAVTNRVRVLLDACGLLRWRDLMVTGTDTRIAVWLGTQREAGEINGRTYNYYVRDFKSFCRWLAERLGRTAPLQKLAGVDNADSDSEVRRSLSVEEMRWLVDAAAAGPVRQRLTGDERAVLYRFAFETGIRPAQIRALTVADFKLDADPPTVSTAARYVKRRRAHTQVLRPSLADLLRQRFKAKMPTTMAIRMPVGDHAANMLRADLADARAAWLAEKGLTDKEREERHRSDFLAAVNHQGERAVFYSTRHGHGTALAAAGVPEKDIAASMHHASRTTTARYIHADRKSVGAAIGTLPDLAPTPAAQKATGTDGKSADPASVLRTSCATGETRADAGGQNDPRGVESEPAENTGNAENPGENSETAPWRNWQTQWIQNPPPTPPIPNQIIGNREDGPSVLRPSCALPTPDDDLSTVIQAWPALAPDVRAMIVAVVLLTPRAPSQS